MLKERISAYMDTHDMTRPGDCILAGLSGGADSVALLLLLHDLALEKDLHLEAIHVEHGIRGAESHRDADFARELCESLAIPFHLIHVDVPAYCSRHHMGLEEAARILRYQAFEEAAEQILMEQQSFESRTASCQGRISLALAHHMDDNAETILFQEIRGSGLKGLCGMSPVREEGMRKIRPLLCVTRQEIEKYLAERKQPYCVDSTNTDLDFSRNRLRHQVIPALKEINPRAVEHMADGARQLQMIWQFMEIQVAQSYNECVKRWDSSDVQKVSQRLELDLAVFAGLHPAVQNALLMRLLEELMGSRKDLGSLQVEQLLSLAAGQSGKRVSLADGWIAGKSYQSLFFRREETADGTNAAKDPAVWCIPLPSDPADSVEILVPGGRICCRKRAFSGVMSEIPKNTYTKWFDYAIVKNGPVLRHRRPGDYLVIDEAGHRKKLQNYLVDCKVPEEERDEIILLASGSEILWVIGGRSGWQGRISEETKMVLEIRFMEG